MAKKSFEAAMKETKKMAKKGNKNIMADGIKGEAMMKMAGKKGKKGKKKAGKGY